MATAPFHNRAQFERAVEKLIQQADGQNRGADLDRLIRHLQKAPEEVSKLASLLMLVDDDFRPALKSNVDAYRRFESQKGRDLPDDEVLTVMLEVYRKYRKA